MALFNGVKIGLSVRVTLLIGALILATAASVGIWTYSQLNAIIVNKEFLALNKKNGC